MRCKICLGIFGLPVDGNGLGKNKPLAFKGKEE